MKLARTGKTEPGSSPPMLYSIEPERVASSEAETTGIDQSREWEEGLRDKDTECADTVGYEPVLASERSTKMKIL